MSRRGILICFVLSIVGSMIAGCGTTADSVMTSGSSEKESKIQVEGSTSPKEVEPVTLLFNNYKSGLTDEEFQNYFAGPVNRKYPNITLNRVTGNPANLITQGTIPDIILTGKGWIPGLKLVDLPLDLNDLIKKNKVDLNSFVPEAIQAIKSFGDNGQLYSLPYAMNYGALFYNKDLFNKFGVSYPIDNMNWDQVLEAARKLTREENGIQYIGWDPGGPDFFANQFSVAHMDVKTGKALIDTAPYRTIFSLLKQVYDLPGFIGSNNKYNYGTDGFLKDKVVAMNTNWGNSMVGLLENTAQQGDDFNWDLVTIPNFKGKEGNGMQVEFNQLLITKSSKHIDQAMQVLLSSISAEVQTLGSKNGRLPALNDPTIEKVYGANLKSFQGKHISSILKMNPSPNAPLTEYDDKLRTIVSGVTKEMIVNKKDINTALREAQAAGDQYIQEEKSK